MSMLKMTAENMPQGDPEIIAGVMGLYDNGAEVLFSRSHTGEAKIKVRYGPFKMRTARYTVNDKTAVAIKDLMRARIKK
jgi:hypothetical protein